jgi:AraC-like DNA-binding protein
MHERVHEKHHFLFACIDLNPVFARHPELRRPWHGLDAAWTPRGESAHYPFRQLMREITMDSLHRTAALRLAVDSLAIAATRLVEGANTVSFLQIHPAALEARRMVEANPGHDWRVEQLASACGLSVSHFAHMFTQEVGVSPRQFIIRARIDMAKSLLESSGLSISTIALECGFATVQHFARAFKEATGDTAGQYRHQVQNRAGFEAPGPVTVDGGSGLQLELLQL